MNATQIDIAGRALCAKVQAQAKEHGARRAAANLRKQGYPLQLALALIVGRLP